MSDIRNFRYGLWLAVTAIAIAVAGCSGAQSTVPASPAGSSSAGQVAASQGPWKLVAPVQAAGLPYDGDAVQLGLYDEFMPSLSGVNKDLKSEGHARSDVFGIYDLRPATGKRAAPVVVFSGYNGTFNPQAVIHTESEGTKGAKVFAVAAGPHGGSAVCLSSGSGASAGGACIWATDTTFGALFESGTGSQAVSSLPSLMIKLRADLEVLPGQAAGPGPGQLLVRSSGSASGHSASFVASTDKLKVTYTFKCGAPFDNGNFIATLTPDRGGADAYAPSIADLVGAGKTGTTTLDAPLGGVRYHVSVISEDGCTWSVVVRTD